MIRTSSYNNPITTQTNRPAIRTLLEQTASDNGAWLKGQKRCQKTPREQSEKTWHGRRIRDQLPEWTGSQEQEKENERPGAQGLRVTGPRTRLTERKLSAGAESTGSWLWAETEWHRHRKTKSKTDKGWNLAAFLDLWEKKKIELRKSIGQQLNLNQWRQRKSIAALGEPACWLATDWNPGEQENM
jgi:hypothetical protein